MYNQYIYTYTTRLRMLEFLLEPPSLCLIGPDLPLQLAPVHRHLPPVGRPVCVLLDYRLCAPAAVELAVLG